MTGLGHTEKGKLLFSQIIPTEYKIKAAMGHLFTIQ